jgi:hypothetical protein
MNWMNWMNWMNIGKLMQLTYIFNIHQLVPAILRGLPEWLFDPYYV